MVRHAPGRATFPIQLRRRSAAGLPDCAAWAASPCGPSSTSATAPAAPLASRTIAPAADPVVVIPALRGLEVAGGWAQAGTGDQAAQDGAEELGTFEPVGSAEGLVAEATPAATAAETLDTCRCGGTGTGAIAHDAPTDLVAVTWAIGVGTERGRLGGATCRSCPGYGQAPGHHHSPEHNGSRRVRSCP
jgi:hypothetical protein